MVNLRDGSVLIVYYEEGAGSSIRAKRFRISDGGVQWLTFPSDEIESTPGPANTRGVD